MLHAVFFVSDVFAHQLSLHLGCVGLPVHVDQIQFAGTLLHVVGEVIHCADDEQVPCFDGFSIFFQCGGDLVVDVGLHAVDVGHAFGDLDGVQLFLDGGFELAVIAAGGSDRAATRVADDEQQGRAEVVDTVFHGTFGGLDLVADVADHEQVAFRRLIQHVGLHARVGAGDDGGARVLSLGKFLEELGATVAGVDRFGGLDFFDKGACDASFTVFVGLCGEWSGDTG